MTVNAWLASSHLVSGVKASQLVQLGIWLGDHDEASAAFATGDVSAAHLSVMRSVSERNRSRREAFAECEGLFVELARHADPSVLRRAMNAWADNVDPDTGDDDADRAYEERRFFLTPVADGWELAGHLPGVMGAELAGILNEFMTMGLNNSNPDASGPRNGEGVDAESRDSGRDGASVDRRLDGRRDRPGSELSGDRRRIPARARLADALMEMARAAAQSDLTAGAKVRASTVVTLPGHRLHPTGAEQGGGGGDLDRDGGIAASVYVETGGDAPSLRLGGMFDGRRVRPERQASAWAVGNGPGQGFLAGGEAAWLTCDGEIARLILDPQSRPLDLGRSTRVVTAALRRALDARDGGCVMPGCDRPPRWCEAHHVQHWADGGRTDISNLALTCSKHHHELHLGHWRISMHDGLPSVEHIPIHLRADERRRQRHEAGHISAQPPERKRWAA